MNPIDLKNPALKADAGFFLPFVGRYPGIRNFNGFACFI